MKTGLVHRCRLSLLEKVSNYVVCSELNRSVQKPTKLSTKLSVRAEAETTREEEEGRSSNGLVRSILPLIFWYLVEFTVGTAQFQMYQEYRWEHSFHAKLFFSVESQSNGNNSQQLHLAWQLQICVLSPIRLYICNIDA